MSSKPGAGQVLITTVKIRYHQHKRVDWELGLGALFIVTLVVMLFGGAVARYQVNQKDTYTVTLRDNLVLNNVRIVRSSGTGFIVVVADRIMFMPTDEIKLIRADRDVRR